MKIISPGKIPEEKSCEWTCKNCKAIIEAKVSEGRFVYDQRDGDAVVFICPQCEINNWVSIGKFK